MTGSFLPGSVGGGGGFPRELVVVKHGVTVRSKPKSLNRRSGLLTAVAMLASAGDRKRGYEVGAVDCGMEVG